MSKEKKEEEKKKKLVIASDNYLPRWDGIARVLSEIIPRLAKDFDITVIAPDYGTTNVKNFSLVKIPVRTFEIGDFHPAKFKYHKIKRTIRDADVVFTQTIGPIGICSIIASKRLGKPIASFIHSIEWELFPKAVSIPLLKKFLYPLSKKLVRFLYNKSNLLIVPSDNVSDMMRWQRINTRKKIVHLGVDTKKFVKGNKNKSKKALGLKPSEFIIGYHGRLGREKDLKTLARAFIRLRKTHKNARLLVVGAGVRDIEKLFRNQEAIIYVGQQNNVVPYIQAMDVYVLPSLTETSSLTTLEAMSCELPVIATKVGFVKDYIEHGKNGMFFTKQHPFELAKKIEALMDDLTLREELGRNARKTILKDFRWEVTAERMSQAIKSIVKE